MDEDNELTIDRLAAELFAAQEMIRILACAVEELLMFGTGQQKWNIGDIMERLDEERRQKVLSGGRDREKAQAEAAQLGERLTAAANHEVDETLSEDEPPLP